MPLWNKELVLQFFLSCPSMAPYIEIKDCQQVCRKTSCPFHGGLVCENGALKLFMAWRQIISPGKLHPIKSTFTEQLFWGFFSFLPGDCQSSLVYMHFCYFGIKSVKCWNIESWLSHIRYLLALMTRISLVDDCIELNIKMFVCSMSFSIIWTPNLCLGCSLHFIGAEVFVLFCFGFCNPS